MGYFGKRQFSQVKNKIVSVLFFMVLFAMSSKANVLFGSYANVLYFAMSVGRPISYRDLLGQFDCLNKQKAAFWLSELESAGYLSMTKGGRGRGNISSYTVTDLFFRNMLEKLGKQNIESAMSKVLNVKPCDEKTIDWIGGK